ncbi:hypothetical protein B0H14DRAFT_2569935 [Mycena olivaceomarginata]|nr:hypothetical protein B0H14DRAFT_2569935 [Mycena olivaceomarginata]
MERVSSSVWQDADASQPTRETTELHGDFDNSNSTRPELPERQDTPRGGRLSAASARGVDIDGGHEGMPMGKASATDKLIGKGQELVGKVTKKPEMHGKGELRESGGKSAAAGDARTPPHD